MPEIELIGHFFPGQLNFFGIYHNYMITRIDMRCKFRLILTS